MKFSRLLCEYYKMNKRMNWESLVDLDENITRWIRGLRDEVQWIWMRILQDPYKRMKEWSSMDLVKNITRWIRGLRDEVQ